MHVGTGDAKKVWHLPEKLLKSKSTFFTAALEGGFAEALSKKVTLSEEDPDIFRYFVEWLYVGYGNQGVHFEPNLIVCLWIMGDRLGCPLMQDDAMRNLVHYDYDSHIEKATLKQIYEGSAPGSKIRQFAVDRCLFDIRQRCPVHQEYKCPYLDFVKDNEDFAQQLAVATILLGNKEPDHPSYYESSYLCAQ